MVAPISTQTQLPSARDRPGVEPNPRGWRHSPLATNAKATPGPGCPSPVYTCSFHPGGHRGRLAWLCILLPTLGSREGPQHHHHPGPRQPLSTQPKAARLPFPKGRSNGARGRGGVCASSPLLSVLAPECVCLGNQCCSGSRIGWASLSSALSFAVPLS